MGTKNVPTRSTFTGIAILVGRFGLYNVGNTRHTHTQFLHVVQSKTNFTFEDEYSSMCMNQFNKLSSGFDNQIDKLVK